MSLPGELEEQVLQDWHSRSAKKRASSIQTYACGALRAYRSYQSEDSLTLY